MIRSLLAVFLLLAFSVPAAAAPSRAALRKEARAAFQSGNYDLAASLYEKIAASEPREAMWAFWNMGRADRARSLAEAVLRETPDDAEAGRIVKWSSVAVHRDDIRTLHLRAKAAYQEGRRDEAIATYRRILELDPDNILFARDYMWLLWNERRYRDAKTAAERVLVLHPGDREAADVVEKCESIAARPAPEAPDDKNEDIATRAARRPDNRNLQRQWARSLYADGKFAEAQAILQKLLSTRKDEPAVWYQLGRVQMALKDFRGAILSLERSLALDGKQPDVSAALGKSYMGSRDLKKGVAYLEQAIRTEGNVKKSALPTLAKALYYEGAYRRSAEAWGEAAVANDEKVEYRFREAEALFYAGDRDAALARMKTIYQKHHEPLAAKFLTDNAVARGDYAVACALLEDSTGELTVRNSRDVLRLSSLYQQMGAPEKSQLLLRRWTAVFPTDIPALLGLASVSRQLDAPADASTAYRAALQLNPFIIDAWMGLAECQFTQGQTAEGIASLRKAHDLEPGNPYVLRRLARGLAEHGASDEARALLSAWIDRNAGAPTLPILLYHGLTTVEGAPMLAYPEHMTVASFESQMRGLSEAGFQPVTIAQVAAWYAGKGALPKKPVFITFDDARIDGFANADPILEKYRLKATMFVPLDNVETPSAIGFATWETIERFQKTGRWDIQSHGANAHSKIVVDANGRESLSMVMPQWKDDLNRVETEEEWRQRVDDDHATSARVIHERLGKAPIGFAYAEGLYGQRSEAASAVPINVASVKKHFALAFIQDDFGMNPRTEDPLFLRRVEPENGWSGARLVRHIADQSPASLIYRDLIGIALREKRFADAEAGLERLRETGVSERILTKESARVAYASGRLGQARQLARDVLAQGPDADMDDLLRAIHAENQPAWRPGVEFEKDSQGRETWNVHQEFELPLSAEISALLSQRYEHFQEDGRASVEDVALGAGASASWARRHDVSAQLLYHDLLGGVSNLLGYAASYRFHVDDRLAVRAETRRRPYGSARALRDNIRETLYRVDTQLGQGDWGWFARGRLSQITNGNQRRGAETEYRLPLGSTGVLGPVVRLGYDDMKNRDPRYYSPKHLVSGAAGLQLSVRPRPSVKLVARYLPGYAKERGSSREFVQSVVGRLRWAINKQTSFEPSLSYQETAHYHDTIASVDFERRF